MTTRHEVHTRKKAELPRLSWRTVEGEAFLVLTLNGQAVTLSDNHSLKLSNAIVDMLERKANAHVSN